MPKTLKRLLLAAAISALGVVCTYAWDNLTADGSSHSAGGVAIARLTKTVHEVERKPSQRLIWEPISEGAELYAGETLRTSGDAEASVQFVKSRTRVQLEPDSEIVIEEANGKIQLNFLKGNLLVAGNGSGEPGAGVDADGGADADGDGDIAGHRGSGKVKVGDGNADGGITLQAGGKQIALGKSEISVSQNNRGKVDVTVIKGEANLASSSQIRVLSPAPNELLYVDPKEKSAVPVAIEPIPSGYRLILEVGKRRDEMRPIEFSPAAGGAPGKMVAAFKPGRFYWRIVAKPSESGAPDLASPLFRLNVLAKLPVVLLKPEKDEIVALEDLKNEVGFGWSNPSRLAQLRLEIFKGRDFSKPVVSEFISEDAGEITSQIRDAGEYTWRISGKLRGNDGKLGDVVSAPVRAFKAIKRRELAAPALASPRNEDVVPFQTFAEKGLDFRWKPVEGAVRYKVILLSRATGEAQREFEAASPLINLRDLIAGDYTWNVVALGPKSEMSKPSASYKFSLQQLARLSWSDGKVEAEQKYFTSQPSVDLSWEAGPEYAVKYRVRLTGERDRQTAVADDSAWSLTGTTTIFKGLPADGDYIAEVEALDAGGHIVARAPKRKIAVAAQPLLAAPTFNPPGDTELTAESNGSVRVGWDAVPGAAEYIVKYEGKSRGSASAEVRARETESLIKRLMPGKYIVTLRAVDGSGRAGKPSEPRRLTVPDTSDVRAPKVRKFQVE